MWLKLRKQVWKWRGVLMTAPTVAAIVISANSAGLFQLLEWATLDLFFRYRPSEPTDPRIVIVTIDENDLTKVGQWPMPDAVLAQLLEKVSAYEPRVIGIDLYRNFRVEPGSERLEQVFESTPNLIGIEKVVGNRVKPPRILEDLGQVAMADLVLDPDGKVRRSLLSVVTDDDETKLSLSARISLMYLEAEGKALEAVDPNSSHLQLGQARFIPLEGNEGGYVRADTGGYQIFLNYKGREKNFKTISMTDILTDRISPDLIRDRVVLVGVTAESLNDLFLTPYSAYGNSLNRMPGVVIHANAIAQILSAALDGRPFIQVWRDSAEWFWVIFNSLFGATVSYSLLQARIFKNNSSGRWAIFAVWLGLGNLGLLIGGYVAFLNSWWIPIVSPIVALTTSAITIAGYYSRGLQRDSQSQLTQFLEAMPVAIAVLDAKGKPYYTNQKAKELLGKGPVTNAPTQRLSDVYQIYFVGSDRPYPSERLPIVRALHGDRTTADDMEIHRPDATIPIEAWGTPIYDDNGNISYAMAAFQDITDRKQVEAERERFTKELFELNQNLEDALDAELELTDAYGRFVPHEFLYFLGYESIVEVKLGEAVEMEMSILFSDIRDFTTLSEGMTPEDNFKFINSYLSSMEPAIADNNGFIDKYIGDAIMALFSGSADDAVKAGITMLNQLAEYNQGREQSGYLPIHIGIGINTGSLMLGTVGGQKRMDSTVISDAVNLASRIEGLTKNYGVALLIGDRTFCSLKDPNSYNIRHIDRVQVKGKSEIVSVYEVFDADPPAIREGKLITKSIFEEAIQFYNKGSYPEAARFFQKCLRINPEDKVAQIYLERTQSH
ncbi:CHASE2 domain-containing protein [Laspinema sp. D3]|nr:CHASE2 domain-containing protein [Laspinema sp. D2c]